MPLPATTHIDLPPIKVEGHYLEIFQDSTMAGDFNAAVPPPTNRKHHGFLSVSVHIGSLEQNLTTDLLNHMIFFQKGFVKVSMHNFSPFFNAKELIVCPLCLLYNIIFPFHGASYCCCLTIHCYTCHTFIIYISIFRLTVAENMKGMLGEVEVISLSNQY